MQNFVFLVMKITPVNLVTRDRMAAKKSAQKSDVTQIEAKKLETGEGSSAKRRFPRKPKNAPAKKKKKDKDEKKDAKN